MQGVYVRVLLEPMPVEGKGKEESKIGKRVTLG